MANIRRSHHDGNGSNRQFNRLYQYEQLGPNAHRIPFLVSSHNRQSPRQESFWDMLRIVLCPKITFISFTTFLLIANTILFIICVNEGLQRSGTLLQVSDQTLIKFGAMVPSYIKENGAFYVLFTSLFLSLDFMNFLINCICIMILASTVEGSVGSYCTAVICIGGGIMGALFGAMAHCCNEQPYLEMSALVYALMGSMMAFFILNWEALNQLDELRCFTLCLMMMLVFLICLVTLSGSEENKYDKFGSIGGLLGGFFLALATAIPVREGGSYEKKCSIFGWTFTIIQISICLLMIYIAE